MENKINIAELLKDCPKGTKLYSPLVGECTLEHIHSELKKILISASDGTTLTFHNNGTYFQMDNSECLLFPSKDQRDWSKFQRPFVDGDIVTWEDRGSLVACIYKKRENITTFNHHIALYNGNLGIVVNGEIVLTDDELCFATEEEKQKLFDAIKANGYKWNEETKTLEKLPKFKVGDRIKYINGKNKDGVEQGVILSLTNDTYDVAVTNDMGIFIPISEQDDWELVPNKFDITTLVPFESRVLVRNVDGDLWKPAIYGFPHSKGCYVVGGVYWGQCIPYEENKELLGTTNNLEEYGSR